jgi:hypothetical protein
MIIGPGRTPWISIAAISTAAGAEPGMPSVSTGMIAPGTQALSPVSAAISPSIDPLPNFSGSLLARFAAAYDDHAATSSPTPGRIPMKVPIRPERRIVFQYFVMSTSFGITRVERTDLDRDGFFANCHQSSAKPKAPTSAGTRLKPPARSRLPKLNRFVRVDRFLPDCRRENADQSANPTLERIVAGERAGDDHAEQREPEKTRTNRT